MAEYFFEDIDLTNDLCHSCLSSVLDIKLGDIFDTNKDQYLRLIRDISRQFHPDKFRHEKATLFTQLINGLKEMVVSYFDLSPSLNEHKCEDYEELKEYIYQAKKGKTTKRPIPEENDTQPKKRQKRTNMKKTSPPKDKQLEKIISHKTHNKTETFLVKWVGSSLETRIPWGMVLRYPEQAREYLLRIKRPDPTKTFNSRMYNHLEKKYTSDFLDLFPEE